VGLEKRKGDVHSAAAYQQAVRKRLNELRTRFPQSEIARRTKTPLTNVHRYMNTGKVPAEFCSALVEAFEVNPAWLLAGAGGALLTEVDSGAAKIGSDMLTMIEAMNAVSRVRLGALAGKQQEKTLRELSDSIGAYERLRERMNAQTRPVLEQLIRQFTELANHMELERAGSIRRAALQVAKFCDDEELLWQLDNQQASHDHLMGKVDSALQFHMKLFARKLRDGALKDADACSQAGSLVLALRDSGRFEEGRRICRAAIELCVDEVKAGTDYYELCVISGSLDVELGDLHTGLAQIQKTYCLVEPRLLSFPALMLLRAELIAGLATLADGRARVHASRGRSRMMLRHAALIEDAAELKATRDYGIGRHETQVMSDEYEARRSAILLAALTKPKASQLAQFDALVRESPPPVNSPHLKAMLIAIQRAQIARLAASKREAIEATIAAQAALEAVPPDHTATIDVRAVQARNVLTLIADNEAGSKLRAQAQDFLDTHIRLGYSVLRSMSTLTPR
jgi:hypothetical protein